MASVKTNVIKGLSVDRTQQEAELIFTQMTTALQGSLVNEGDSLRFPGFGTMTVVLRAARQARNPRTGESIQVPEKLVIKFKQAPRE